jgi:fatty-acyl-CoA synthase
VERRVHVQGIAYWIDKRASINPNRKALINETCQQTYQEMAKVVNRMARALSEHYRVCKGDRIAILSQNGIEYVQLLFAIAKIGCIAVPLNIRLTSKELEFQLKDSEAALLIVGKEFVDRAEDIQGVCTLKDIVLLEGEEQEQSFFKICFSYPSNHFEPTHITGSTPLIICYTSGTAGQPKGAVLTHDNMYWNAVNNILALDITSEDRIITLLPLFHIGGIGLFTLPALLVGGTVIVPQRFDPEETLQIIEDEKVSIVMGVPTIFDLLRKSKSFDAKGLGSVRWLVSGGAPCPHELIEYYLEQGIPFSQGFGMTETSPTVFMLSKEDYKRKIGSIGKPVMFCDIRIVDDQGKDVNHGEVGELLVMGPNVISEYWKLPGETSKSFDNGWLYTGDLAKKDDEGFIYIVGRKKEMIISGGENIYPLEIERVYEQHPYINEVAVIGVSDEKWGEVPLAILAFKDGYQISESELVGYCMERLAKYKCPKHFKIVNALPRNATGKIDKARLRKQYSTVS